MRILITTVTTPFHASDADRVKAPLVLAFRRAGHEVDVWEAPLAPRTAQQVRRAMDVWTWDVLQGADGEPVDLVVPLRFPAYAPAHPSKAAWLLDRYPPTPNAVAHESAEEEEAFRGAIVGFDNKSLLDCHRRSVPSETAQQRLQTENGLSSELLAAPAPGHSYFCEEALPYLFAPEPLGPANRHALLIEALAATPGELAVVFTGAGSPEAARMQALAEELGVAGRVRFAGGLTEEQRSKLYASATAVFVGAEAATLSLSPLEAMLSAKPVLAFSDGGAAAELVIAGETGVLADAGASSLTEALSEIAGDATLARRMGLAGLMSAEALDLSWDGVAEQLAGA